MPDQFNEDVFPGELEEIANRRDAQDLTPPECEGAPSVNKGLIGLALSGGGIRSATVSLGVIQALVKHGKFRFVDYLSTVSGGGYVGSCVSSVLNRDGVDESAFADLDHEEDTPVVRHLRNSSNYLIPGGVLDQMRLPMILLRGILLNLWLLIPALILGVFLTELATELWHRAGAPKFSPLFIAAPFILFALFYPPILRIIGGKFDWRLRNIYENSLSALFTLLILMLAAVPILTLVRYCVDNNWNGHISSFFQTTTAKAGLIQFGIVILALVIFLSIIKTFKKFPAAARIIINTMVGILGPVVVFGIYLLLCIFFIESPYFSDDASERVELHKNKDTNPYKSIATDLIEKEKDILYSNVLSYISESEDPDSAAYRSAVKLIATELKANHVEIPEDWDPTTDFSVTAMSEGWRVKIEGAPDVEIQKSNHHLFIPEKSLIESFHAEWAFYAAGLFILILNFLFFDVNVISTHGFYRDRLSRAFQFEVTEEGSIIPDDDQRLSKLSRDGTTAPYHLINATVNLSASKDSNLRGRNGDFFTFSKRHCGGDFTGYYETTELERIDPRINLGSAMAISAAAAGPNMGAVTNPSVVFIMALLNLRLGYWVPNPSWTKTHWRFVKALWPNVGPRYLLREAFGRVHADDSHVNLSDGGHLENTAIYQLLKRRCKTIIAVDAEADPDYSFNGMVTLVRLARIDMGIQIEVNLDSIRANEEGLSENHFTVAKIHYGIDEDGNPETGDLIYIKSSFSGDENEYIKAYRKVDHAFPHQTTADQFFDEVQFEVYRSLGQHIGTEALSAPEVSKLIGRFQQE